MKVTAQDGQTLADIAIQEYGSLEAVTALARLNGMAVAELPAAGRALTLPDRVYDRTMQAYCKAHEVSPATARDTSGLRSGIFTKEFTLQFQ